MRVVHAASKLNHLQLCWYKSEVDELEWNPQLPVCSNSTLPILLELALDFVRLALHTTDIVIAGNNASRCFRPCIILHVHTPQCQRRHTAVLFCPSWSELTKRSCFLSSRLPRSQRNAQE